MVTTSRYYENFLADESVDLIYLDPPFNSNASYNVLFKEQSGERSAAQITAFEDTWRWGWESETAYGEVVRAGPQPLSRMVQAMFEFLGRNDMMAYLVMMAQRMIELRRVLKPTGSIYLHCDPTASHYLKLLMDATFGAKNILNEIIWYYRGAGIPKGSRARRHDVILWYAKETERHYFNPDPIRQPYPESTEGRPWGQPLKKPEGAPHESGIMVLEEQTRPRNKEHPIDAATATIPTVSASSFDDHRLVANAGLLLPATLARHLGLQELVDHHLDLGGAPGRANTGDKMLTLVASALAGGDCIDDRRCAARWWDGRCSRLRGQGAIHPGDLPAQLPVGACPSTRPRKPPVVGPGLGWLGPDPATRP